MNKFLRKYALSSSIDLTKKLIISVSGGVDSMVLLDFLRRENANLVVVHFNHQQRSQSTKEAAMVQDYCIKYQLPFHYYVLNFTTTSDFQNKARILRHNHLEEVANRYQTPYILTGHHLDDLLETILIKITRGSNLKGYAGMSPVTRINGYLYLKPFLYIPKEELIRYAELYHVPYLTDQSNFTDEYLRNRYRLTIVPIMKQENEQLLRQIKHYSKQLSDAYEHIRSESEKFLKDTSVIYINKFLKLDSAVQDDVISYWLETNNIAPNYFLISRIKKIMTSKKPNQTITLNNKFQLVKFYQKVEIRPKTEIYFKKVKLEPNFKTDLEFFYSTKRTTSNNFITIKLRYNDGDLQFPLWARNREDGDILEYNYGTKKLKKLLIDAKIPTEERDKMIIIADDKGRILWIPGYYINQTLKGKNNIYLSFNGGVKK